MVSDQAGVVILILQPLMTVQMVTLRYFSEQDRWQCHNSEPVSSDESSFENFDPFNGFEFVDP